MQKLMVCGALLDLAADVIIACSDTSGAAVTGSLLMGAIPAAYGLANIVGRAMSVPVDPDEFRVETIRR